MAKKPKDQKKFDQIQANTKLKNIYFNRYLMIRYFLAIFMFVNFYWLILASAWIKAIPVGLLVLGIASCIEMVKAYGKKEVSMKWTKYFFQVQMMVNIVCFILIWTPAFHSLLPFFKASLITYMIACSMYVVGGLMAFACVRRLKQIDENTDKQYAYIQQCEKTINMNI